MCCKDVEHKLTTVTVSPPVAATTPLKVLLCSENVPPQVNGIARRIGHYASGLEQLGCDVELLHPDCTDKTFSHVNPWNFTARMMILKPLSFWKLLMEPVDVVHVVMPLNLSGMWLLAGFKLLRTFHYPRDTGSSGSTQKRQAPALVVSWHCNLHDYIECHTPVLLRWFVRLVLTFGLCWILPRISDRILTPTRATEPLVTSLWRCPPEEGAESSPDSNDKGGKMRAGVCHTGIALDQFDPDTVTSHWGKRWEARKQAYLKATGKKFLLLCVSRLSPEKGIQELLQAMTIMDNCALWLVGDGPFRQDLEQQAEALGLPVKFWGYQSGDALHSVYSAGDCFVCPSLTETFGQTVNEALAMNMRVALPRVSVFTEAYGEFITGDAFWDPLNREGMAASIQTQLERHAKQSPVGRPDRSKLKTWEAACESLLVEYHKAALDAQAQYDQRRVQKKVLCILPFWVLLTAIISVAVLLFSKIVLLVDSIPKFAQQHLPNSLEMKIHKARIMLSGVGQQQQQQPETKLA